MLHQLTPAVSVVVLFSGTMYRPTKCIYMTGLCSASLHSVLKVQSVKRFIGMQLNEKIRVFLIR